MKEFNATAQHKSRDDRSYDSRDQHATMSVWVFSIKQKCSVTFFESTLRDLQKYMQATSLFVVINQSSISSSFVAKRDALSARKVEKSQNRKIGQNLLGIVFKINRVFLRLAVRLSVCLSVCLSVGLSVGRSVCQLVCLCICVSGCLFPSLSGAGMRLCKLY